MKRMHWLLAAGLMLGATFTAQPRFARSQDSVSQTANLQSANPDQVVDSLAAKLNLTDEQKNQIKPIIEERRQRMAGLKNDPSMRRGQKMRNMKSILKESDRKIEAILTPEQKQQYLQIEQRMRDKMRERRQGSSE